MRVPTEEEEQARAIHRQGEQLVKVRKLLEAQERSLMVNHGVEPVQQWWKVRAFAALNVPQWMRQLLGNTQSILLALQEKIDQLTLQLQNAATEEPPRGLGKMTSVIIDREIGNWHRFNRSPANRQLHRALSRRIQQWSHSIAKLRNQTR